MSFNRRKERVRKKIKGTASKPRLSVFRSNKKIYAQLIDDEKAATLVFVGEKDLKLSGSENKIEKARLLGKILAQKTIKKKVKQVVFDRGGYRYLGRVKALAEGAREEGLKF